MNNDVIIVTSLVGLFVWCLILYYIIKSAVKSGISEILESNADLIQQLRIMNNLKLEEMRNSGFSENRLIQVIADTKNSEE